MEKNTSPTTPKGILNPIESAMARLTPSDRRKFMRKYDQERARWPLEMKAEQVPEDMAATVLGAWRSRSYAATAWVQTNPLVLCRLSVNRTAIDEKTGSWLNGISWDALFRIKNECGFRDFDAVEVFPAYDRLVNVANMRHLFIMAQQLPFGLQV